MDFIDVMLDFAYTLAGGDEFWAGFWFCLQWAIIFWLGSLLLKFIDVRWKRVRQFFAPTKKPGWGREELGPSPAEQGFGCLGNLLFVVLMVVLIFAVLLSLFSPEDVPW